MQPKSWGNPSIKYVWKKIVWSGKNFALCIFLFDKKKKLLMINKKNKKNGVARNKQVHRDK